MSADPLIGMAQAAALAKRDRQAMQKAASAGRLGAVKVGGRWFTSADALGAYIARTQAGRDPVRYPGHSRAPRPHSLNRLRRLVGPQP